MGRAQVGGEVDKLCETKGLDFIDREKAKRQAREQVGQVKRSSNELCWQPLVAAFLISRMWRSEAGSLHPTCLSALV